MYFAPWNAKTLCIETCIYMHTSVYIHIHGARHMCIYIYIYIYMYIYIYIYIYNEEGPNTHVNKKRTQYFHKDTYIYIDKCLSMYRQMYIYIYIYVSQWRALCGAVASAHALKKHVYIIPPPSAADLGRREWQDDLLYVIS